jgi:hypothetical protein
MPRKRFPLGLALDITEGKLLFYSIYGGDRVPTRRLSMQKTKEVLRLRFELGWGSESFLSGHPKPAYRSAENRP